LPFYASFYNAFFDPLHQGGHPLDFFLGGGKTLRRSREKDGMPEKVQMDAVDIVVVAYFLYEFIGQIADFLHGIVHRRPSAVKPFFHPVTDKPVRMLPLDFVILKASDASGVVPRIVGVVHPHTPKHFDAVAMTKIRYDLQTIGPLLHKLLGNIVFISVGGYGKQLPVLGIEGELAEAGASRHVN
jgi:hypothetical protein